MGTGILKWSLQQTTTLTWHCFLRAWDPELRMKQLIYIALRGANAQVW